MAKIIFKRGDKTFDINMPEGARVVHAAHKLKLPEIPADCRGQCQCGTCHFHVDPSCMVNGYINMEKLLPIGRLNGHFYSKLGQILEREFEDGQPR